MIESVLQVHMSEAEIAANFEAALEKVRQGLEVIVEHEHQPIAVLKAAEPARRKISECIAMLPADSTATIDADFAADVDAVIAAHRESLEPPEWD
jgi:antitoxin (DNA-binding transcriptional repressor) of toxin-antitoxin stability system